MLKGVNTNRMTNIIPTSQFLNLQQEGVVGET